MLLILALLFMASAAYVLAELASAPTRERRSLVMRATEYGRVRVIHGRELPRFRERALEPIIAKLAHLMLRVNPRTKLADVSAKLQMAGMRNTSPSAYLAARAGFGILGFVGGLAVGATASAKATLLLGVGGFALGFIGPSFIVSVRARKRQEAVAGELPDALDLLAVSVEAGLGFDGAVSKLVEHMDGPLIDEFELALSEMRVGEGRAEALKRMAERVPAHEMSTFVRAIVQADQLGISLGRLLRVQAQDARDKRQAAAEEKAAKAPIKMLFPLVIFIFPAMFIVILGPAFLNLAKIFTF
jgi:tight adherence protein C